MKIKPKIKIKLIFVLVLILAIALPLTANAQDTGSTMSGALQSVLSSLSSVMAIILKVLQRILWPIFLAIGGLLNNDILFGYGMEQRLLDVWVTMRNYVNIIFVVLLLVVALFNVLGLNPESEYSIKQFLPKFAIALIAVNFSYIGMKVILDVTNVATTAIFTLPSSISQGVNPGLVKCEGAGGSCTVSNPDTVKKICNAYYGTVAEHSVYKKGLSAEKQNEIQKSILCEEGADNQYTLSKAGMDFFRQYNSRNAGLVLAIQFMNVMDVDKITENFASGKMTASTLAFNILFSVILYVVYGAAYVALFIVLLARLVVLWLFIALSPFVALILVAPNLLPQAGDMKGLFVKNAFAPVLMGIPLTVGYIILDAFKKFTNTTGSDKVAGLETSFELVKLEASGISDLQSMIIAFAAVAVVWMGVFTVARETVAGALTEMIQQGVQGFGRKAAGLVNYIPLIPTGEGGKRVSISQLGAAMNEPIQSFIDRGKGKEEGAKMTLREIQDVARRPAKYDLSKGQTAVSSALAMGTRQGQQAAYNVLESFKKIPGEKQRFAENILERELTPAQREELQAGKLGAGAVQKLRGSRYLTVEETGAEVPRAPLTPQPPAAKVPSGQTAPTGNEAQEQMSTVRSGIEMDVASPELRAAAAAVNNNTDKKAFEAHKVEIDQIKDINSKVAEATTIAGGDLKGANAKKFTDALKSADDALGKKGVDETKRKEIIRKAIEKAGVDMNEIRKVAGVDKYI